MAYTHSMYAWRNYVRRKNYKVNNTYQKIQNILENSIWLFVCYNTCTSCVTKTIGINTAPPVNVTVQSVPQTASNPWLSIYKWNYIRHEHNNAIRLYSLYFSPEIFAVHDVGSNSTGNMTCLPSVWIRRSQTQLPVFLLKDSLIRSQSRLFTLILCERSSNIDDVTPG